MTIGHLDNNILLAEVLFFKLGKNEPSTREILTGPENSEFEFEIPDCLVSNHYWKKIKYMKSLTIQ